MNDAIITGNVLVFLIGLTLGSVPLYRSINKLRAENSRLRAASIATNWATAMAELQRRYPNDYVNLTLEATHRYARPITLTSGFVWDVEWRIYAGSGAARGRTLTAALKLLDAQIEAAKDAPT